MDIKYCPVCGKEQLILGRMGYVEFNGNFDEPNVVEEGYNVFEYECLNCKTIFYARG